MKQIIVLILGIQIVLSILGSYYLASGDEWKFRTNTDGSTNWDVVAATNGPHLVATVLIIYFFCLRRLHLKLEPSDFLKTVSVDKPFKIRYDVTKNGVYRYSTFSGPLRLTSTESTEPLEFPTNCELIEMRN